MPTPRASSKAAAHTKPDLTAELIGRFKGLIAEGVVFPGCKLPPERELAQKFGVSRSAVRQALKVLSVMGVLSQRVGDGTYLGRSGAEILDEPMELFFLLDGVSIRELLEARLMVEPELSALAAKRATSEDLAAMRETLKPIRPFSRERMLEQDLAFDQAIFRAAGNRIWERTFPVIHRAMLASIEVTYQLVNWDYTLSAHRSIYEPIEKRRPEEAYQRMREHLLDVGELLKRAAARPVRASLPDSVMPIPARTGAGRSVIAARSVGRRRPRQLRRDDFASLGDG